jgi:hypothetical protein
MADTPSKIHATYLIDEPPMLVYPTLAKALGINQAVMLQQLHFLLNITEKAKNKYNFVAGRWWVYNSYEEWKRDYFPWLASVTIKGLFVGLEEEGFVLSIQSVKSPLDRRKWYTIDYENYELLLAARLDKKYPMDRIKNIRCIGSKLSDDLTETTTDTTTDTLAPTLKGTERAGRKKKSASAEDLPSESGSTPSKVPTKVPRKRDPLYDAFAIHLWDAKDEAGISALVGEGGRIAQVINGVKNGKGACIGILAYERERQGKEPDRAALALDVEAFWGWYKKGHPDNELKACEKVLEQWIKWRNVGTGQRKKMYGFNPNCPKKCNKGWRNIGPGHDGKDRIVKCTCWDYR